VAKNPKPQQTNGADSAETAGAQTPAAETAVASKKRAKAAKTPSSKAASKKTGAKSGAKKSTPRRGAKKSGSYEPSDDEIRIRAYFVAERRVQLALDGDPANDWIVARQQLIEEASQRRS
jgi:hypothetical protein